MPFSFPQILICLLAGILIIILLTARFRFHPFFALLIACFAVGIGLGMPLSQVITLAKEGFGHVMRSLALIIVLGTTLGVLLEHTGATKVMAAYILRKVGESRAPLAMSITGFVVGLPIFCDSGYIVLSGVNQSLARRTGISIAVMAVSLATGLYSVHCLLPPHPGAAAAAGLIGVDFGQLILTGLLVAIPASIAGYLWARYAGKKIQVVQTEKPAENEEDAARAPGVFSSFLPVVVPILLIAIRSFISTPKNPSWPADALLSLGDPVLALTIGVLLAFMARRGWNRDGVHKVLQESAEKAGGILVIIGAGGAFGAVLAATQIGDHFNNAPALASFGIFFPFLITCILKTAQGSSTVAIITASSIVLPLLPVLQLQGGQGPLLAVLSMGAGSMMVSHANDAYFWVIAKFSGLDMKTMLYVYTIASVLMGLVSLLFIYILSFLLL